MPPSLSLYEDQLKTSLISKTSNYTLIHMISVISKICEVILLQMVKNTAYCN